MGENSKIEWTDHTFNVWHGCQKVSPGCENCYAETLSKRWGKDIWGPAKTTDRQMMSPDYWRQPARWDRKAQEEGRRARVFCASMADVFEAHPAVEGARAKLVNVINSTPNLIWLLLTKRPENVLPMLELALMSLYEAGLGEWETPAEWLARLGDRVWIGTSVEDQVYADQRIPYLLQIPAAVRFLSVEPLLGPIDLWGARYLQPSGGLTGAVTSWERGVQWVIVGGESGPYSRPMDPAWALAIRDACVIANVPFFFKQWGEWGPDKPDQKEVKVWLHQGRYLYRQGKKEAGRLLEGREWSEFPNTETLQCSLGPV